MEYLVIHEMKTEEKAVLFQVGKFDMDGGVGMTIIQLSGNWLERRCCAR